MHQLLKEAIEDDCAPVVEGLLADRPHWVNQADKAGTTPLMLAIENARDNIECVQILLDMGADVNVTLPNGETPLLMAVASGSQRLKCVRALLEAGADVNAKIDGDFSVLHWAVADLGPAHSLGLAKRTELFALLVKAGADLEATIYYGWTPLMKAIMDGDMNDIRALLAVGADPNKILPDNGMPVFNEGQSVLSFALYCWDAAEAMQALIEAGADVNLRDTYGRTTLEYVESRGLSEWKDEQIRNHLNEKRAKCLELLRQYPPTVR